MARGWIAFYAPMKAPDHPTPSGDREIARLTVRALEAAGWPVRVVSDLRLLEMRGDAGAQAALRQAASAEAETLIKELPADPPAAWVTYHCYYKAPDLLGPIVSAALALPYLITEPSISARRREGSWAEFARLSEKTIGSADRLLWTTARDRPALEAAGHGAKMTALPAFLDPGPVPEARPSGEPLQLITVAMMRPGDKTESYRRLAAALRQLNGAWQLKVIGDGPARGEIEAPFSGMPVNFVGAVDDRVAVRAAYEAADVFVWPGVGEGVGMVYLEAQAAGLPVVAEDHPAQRDLMTEGLVPAEDPVAFAKAIKDAVTNRIARGTQARSRIEQKHSLASAARILDEVLTDLTEGRKT